MRSRLVVLLATLVWVGCASDHLTQYPACEHEMTGGRETHRPGDVIDKTPEGFYVFQPADLARDGRHLLVLPDCWKTTARPCLDRSCALVSGLMTALPGPVVVEPRQ